MSDGLQHAEMFHPGILKGAADELGVVVLARR